MKQKYNIGDFVFIRCQKRDKWILVKIINENIKLNDFNAECYEYEMIETGPEGYPLSDDHTNPVLPFFSIESEWYFSGIKLESNNVDDAKTELVGEIL